MRWLDGSSPTLRACYPRVVEAVGGYIEVLMDSGVPRRTDVLEALALGARADLPGGWPRRDWRGRGS